MAEAPELKVLFQVHQLLAHVVRIPMGAGVFVDDAEYRSHAGVARMRHGPVALDAFARHRHAAAREQAQEFVIQARRLQQALQQVVHGPVVAVHIQHARVLVAEHEFDGAELVRLQAGGGAEHVPEPQVLVWRERFQHRPLLEQLALHLLDSGQDLEAGRERIGAYVGDRGGEFVHHQLHPQLRSLVLDDEEHFVVVRGAGPLRREELIEAQVAAVGGLGGEIGDDSGIVGGHGRPIMPPKNRENVMIKVCGFRISNYHNKVLIALHEKGIAFEEYCNVTPSQNPEYLALSPMGKVPFMEVDGTRLIESEVILEYLEEAFPQKPLLPKQPLARAKARELVKV